MLSGKIVFSPTVSFLGLPVAQSFEILSLADHLTFKGSVSYFWLIEHETPCCITKSNSEKKVKNTMRSGRCLTNVEKFLILWWNPVSNIWFHVSSRMILKREIKAVKNEEFFFWFANFLDFPYGSLMNWRSKVQWHSNHFELIDLQERSVKSHFSQSQIVKRKQKIVYGEGALQRRCFYFFGSYPEALLVMWSKFHPNCSLLNCAPRYTFFMLTSLFFLLSGDWHCAYVLLYGPRQLEVVDE